MSQEYFVISSRAVLSNCLKHIQGLPLNGSLEIIIREHKRKRSCNQNSLYWKWLSIISSYTGYTKDELHDEFASRFIGIEERKTISGDIIRQPISTTKLSTKEFAEYMSKIEAYAMGENIILPQPDYYGYENGR